MLVQSFGPRLHETECWAVTNAKTHVVRRVSRSGSLRPVSTAQKVPPKKEPQESRRDRLERAITSFRTPARAAAQKVSSSRTCPVTVTPLSRLERERERLQCFSNSPYGLNKITSIFLVAAATKSLKSRLKPGFRSNTEPYKQLESF